MTTIPIAVFTLGRTLVTAAALKALNPDDIKSSLLRHQAGDWGDLCEEDKRTNDYDLEHGERLLSAYTDTNGTKFWIITERDRSVTTVLLPEDY